MNQSLNEKISIIVPAYNVEKYIEKCLDSLVNQTYKNIEIIIVNDGSKDNTLNIINKYTQKDNRIKVINQENQGLSESRNNALEIVDTKYVMFVDSDDWLDLDTCEIAMNKIEDADIFWFSYMREYDKKSLPKSAFDFEHKVFLKDEVKEKLQRRIVGPIEKELAHPEKLDALSPVWGKLYKYELIKKLEFKSLKQMQIPSGEDMFFNYELLESANKVIFENKNLYHYRKNNDNSVTKRYDESFWNKWKNVYDLLSKSIEGKSEKYKEALNNRIAINIIAIGQRIVSSNNSFKEKYKLLNGVIQDDLYVKSINKLNIKEMPVYWKIFFWNVNKKQTLIVYFLITCIMKMAKIK